MGSGLAGQVQVDVRVGSIVQVGLGPAGSGFGSWGSFGAMASAVAVPRAKTLSHLEALDGDLSALKLLGLSVAATLIGEWRHGVEDSGRALAAVGLDDGDVDGVFPHEVSNFGLVRAEGFFV